MISILSSNITSPLGMTTEENYQAVLAGGSALRSHDDKWHLPESFAASLFTDEQMEAMMVDGHTPFESLMLCSIREALSRTDFDVSSDRVVLIISTTKGNIDLLSEDETDKRIYPGIAAQRIADTLGIRTEPIVVCNACISGVAAQILAQRLLDAGKYDYAIVAGGEKQSKFIVSGFQAFKAVTDEPCRPFDIERLGLNLGDGAGTLIMKANGNTDVKGAIRNDAYHLSAPQPQGDGYLLALEAVKPDSLDDIATLSVHGTATMYNDQMESKGIQRAGMSEVPLTSLKGYYGHTMGAAGVIETIMTMRATEDGVVLAARGFEEIGVSGKVNISSEVRRTEKHSFIKMLSGFGGCNGAMMVAPQPPKGESFKNVLRPEVEVLHRVRITSEGAWVDGVKLDTTATGKALLKELYKMHVNDYPKFYKMDALTRLTFVATEMLLKAEGGRRLEDGETDESRGVIFFNRSSSIVADRQYYKTIKDADDYFPSPASFLYTLPNITTGEVAIRNHYTGETSFYILPEKNQKVMDDILSVSFADEKTKSVIGGWVECENEETFEAEVALISEK